MFQKRIRLKHREFIRSPRTSGTFQVLASRLPPDPRRLEQLRSGAECIPQHLSKQHLPAGLTMSYLAVILWLSTSHVVRFLRDQRWIYKLGPASIRRLRHESGMTHEPFEIYAEFVSGIAAIAMGMVKTLGHRRFHASRELYSFGLLMTFECVRNRPTVWRDFRELILNYQFLDEVSIGEQIDIAGRAMTAARQELPAEGHVALDYIGKDPVVVFRKLILLWNAAGPIILVCRNSMEDYAPPGVDCNLA